MKNEIMKKHSLLRDLGVTVGLLAMTLLSFMSKRVVPMGTNWYLPWGIRICAGIVLLICMVLFWDMVKRGKVDGSVCERCGEPMAPYSIPVYFMCGEKQDDESQIIEMDVCLCRECYHVLKHVELQVLWVGLICCLVPRCVIMVLSVTRWDVLVVPFTPLLNALIALIAYGVSFYAWLSRISTFERSCRLVCQLLRMGGEKIEMGFNGVGVVRSDGKPPFDYTEWMICVFLKFLGLGVMLCLPLGF